ncbi:MAG: SPFH domain-containing protein [Clostridium sp.]|uniref:SPFH domain-containing protein n=1 Tax=Clostridium sp. TaxID=1506 RepID=UPI003046A56D
MLLQAGLIKIVLEVLGGILGLWFLLWLLGFRIIPNDKIAIVEKWWSTKGSLKEQIIALHGEAGYQPNVLRGGIHFKTPLMYKTHIVPLVTVPQGKIAYVFARDGKSLEPAQTLGRIIPEANNFQNVGEFLNNGGQKGPQRGIIREGTYAFNLAIFVIITENRIYSLKSGDKGEQESLGRMAKLITERNGFVPVIIEGSADQVGIVTTHDGPSLPSDNIICPTVGDNPSDVNYHNNFQDIDAFLNAGGFRGRQYQVLSDGSYHINRLFASIELLPKTIIPIGYLGVVVSYTGDKGEDSSGSDYKHGELVKKGCRGVWSEGLMPGKYAFNTYSGSIIKVPTTNVILKWISNQTGNHRLDDNLSEVAIITKDAFEPLLPLSVVFHIDYKKAPLVIQRFGDIKMLVEQTLDPMISAYFKNIGNSRTLLDIIHFRTEIQNLSTQEMKEKFNHYNLELEEVLIGTPRGSDNDNAIETILTQLRSRQVAKEQLETYDTQQKAAEKEKELRAAEAIAKQQTVLTESDINIRIQENQGKAELQKARQDAEKIQKLAEAEAYKVKQQSEADAFRVKVIAEADADKEARVGISKAIAAKEQVNAYGGPQYKVITDVMSSFANAIKEGKIDIVPKTIVNSGGEGSTSNAFESLIMLLLSEKLTNTNYDSNSISSEEVEKLKKELLSNLSFNSGAPIIKEAEIVNKV